MWPVGGGGGAAAAGHNNTTGKDVAWSSARCTDTNKGRAEILFTYMVLLLLEAPLLLPMLALGTESGVPPKQKRAATAAATSSKWMGMVSNRSLANDLIEPAALGGWVVAIVGNRSKD